MKSSPVKNDFENRFNPTFMKQMSDALDEIVKDADGKPAALVTVFVFAFTFALFDKYDIITTKKIRTNCDVGQVARSGAMDLT